MTIEIIAAGVSVLGAAVAGYFRLIHKVDTMEAHILEQKTDRIKAQIEVKAAIAKLSDDFATARGRIYEAFGKIDSRVARLEEWKSQVEKRGN